MAEPNHFELIVSYETKDVWRLYLGRYLTFNTVLIYSVGLSIYGIFISIAFLGDYVTFFQIVGSLILAFVFTLIYLLVIIYYSVETFKKRPKQNYRFEFSHDAIEIASELCTSKIEWQHFSKATENKKYFELHTKDETHYVLPKSCFADAEKIHALRYLLRSKSDVLALSLK